jgi:membrane protease YdiL (CAAX protease family)
LLATLLVTILFCNFIHKEKFTDIGLNAIKARRKDLLFGLLYGILPISFGFMLFYALGLIRVTEIRFVSGILSSLVLYIIVSFNEEIMLRGYVLRRFMSSHNKYIALIIASALFMVLHVFNKNVSFLGLFNLFLAGLLLGVYYIHRQNLWFPIGLHFTWNFFQGPVFGFAVSGGTTTNNIINQQLTSEKDWLTGGAFGFEGSVIAGIIVIVLIVVVHFQYRKQESLIKDIQ